MLTILLLTLAQTISNQQAVATSTTIRVFGTASADTPGSVRWEAGTTASPANVWYPPGSPYRKFLSITVTGLTPATTYSYQLCGGVDGTSCATAAQITTAAAGTVTPTAPTASAVTALPDISGATTINITDCMNPTTGLRGQLSTASVGAGGSKLVLPSSTICSGELTHTRTLTNDISIVWAALLDNTGPPAGSNPLWATIDRSNRTVTTRQPYSAMPKFIASGLTIQNGFNQGAATLSAGQACGPGTTWATAAGAYTTDNNGFSTDTAWRLWKCQFAAATTAVTGISGTTVTSTSHGLTTGQVVCISGVSGINANDCFRVASTPTANTFTVSAYYDGAAVSFTGTYTSGGTVKHLEWQQPSRTTGSVQPSGSCTPGEWYTQTSGTRFGSGYWYENTWRCDTSNRWLHAPMSSAKYGAEVSGTRLNIAGIIVESAYYPEEPENAVAPFTAFTPYGSIIYPIRVTATASRIVFDRVVIDGKAPFVRTSLAIVADGANIAFVNSAIKDVAMRQPRPPGFYYARNENITAGGIFMQCGPGPVLIKNVRLGNVIGLGTHADDQCSPGSVSSGFAQDVTMQNILWWQNETYMPGSAAWSGNADYTNIYFANRQSFEQKRGVRFQYEGIVAVGGWADVQSNACIFFAGPGERGPFAVSSSPGSGVYNVSASYAYDPFIAGDRIYLYDGSSNPLGIGTASSGGAATFTLGSDLGTAAGGYLLTSRYGPSDVLFTNNEVIGKSCFVQFAGYRPDSATPNQGNTGQPDGARMFARNNFLAVLDGTKTTGVTPSNLVARIDWGCENCGASFNTAMSMLSGASQQGWLASGSEFAAMKQYGLTFSDNILPSGPIAFRRSGDNVSGSAALTADANSYTAAGNVLVAASATGQPAGQYYPADISFLRADGYHTRSSSYGPGGANAAPGGFGQGANVMEVQRSTGRVFGPTVTGLGAGGFTLNWAAADPTDTCVARVVNGSGAIVGTIGSTSRKSNYVGQQATVSGLSAGTYTAVAVCRQEQPEISVTVP